MIKPCNKGAGIIVLDFSEHISACSESPEVKTSTVENVLLKLSKAAIKRAKGKIPDIVKEGFDNKILPKEEYTAMLPAEDMVHNFMAAADSAVVLLVLDVQWEAQKCL